MHATLNHVNRRKTLRNVVIFTVAVWSVGWIAAALQPDGGDACPMPNPDRLDDGVYADPEELDTPHHR